MKTSIISLIGGDGSGKTTNAGEIIKKLRLMGVAPIYARPFEEYFILKYLMKPFRNKRLELRDQFLRRELNTGLCVRLWPYLIYFDQLLYWCWIRLFIRGKLIVADRYAYSYLVSWKYYQCDNLFVRKLLKSFPRPDLTLVFAVAPETAMTRKKDENRPGDDLRFFEFHIDEHLRLAREMNFNVINTDCSLASSSAEVLAKIKKLYLSRFSRENRLLLMLGCPYFDSDHLQSSNIDFEWENIRWQAAMDAAVRNGVECLFLRNLRQFCSEHVPSQTMDLCSDWLHKCANQKRKTISAMKLLVESFAKADVQALFFKTVIPFDGVATDLDVLVDKHSFDRARRVLGDIYPRCEPEFMHNSISASGREDLLPVDLHYDISWLGHHPIDEKSVWERRRKFNYHDVSIDVPSPEDEVMIMLAHSIFQHHYTTLGEWYAIVMQASGLDIDYMFSQAGNRGWRKSFEYLFSLLLMKHDFLFDTCLRAEYPELTFMHPNVCCNSVEFHDWRHFPLNSGASWLDMLLTIMRRARFHFNGKLPYNLNWIKASG